MSLTALSESEKAKIRRLVQEGIETKQEVRDLSESLRDTVKAVAKELDVKPAVLNKAITVAFKSSREQENEDHDAVERLLDIV